MQGHCLCLEGTGERGQPQADLGYEGDQQQSHDHAQVEGQSGANHLFHRTLGNSGADEQHRANGRVSRPIP